MFIRFIKRIYVGITKSFWKFLASIFVSSTALWGILEPILGLMPDTEDQLTGTSRYIILITISVVVGLYLVARPLKITFKFRNNTITIQYGDLFAENGVRVIPVSQFMYEIKVFETSLQHLLIKKFTDRNPDQQGVRDYLREVDRSLNDKDDKIVDRGDSNIREFEKKRFELGTVAAIGLGDEEYYLLALTKTELPGHMTEDNCSGTDLWIALEQLWREAKVILRGKSICIPLLGSGVSGIKLSPSNLLDLNILALLNSIAENGTITTGEIKIILHMNYFDEIDLSDVKKRWNQTS